MTGVIEPAAARRPAATGPGPAGGRRFLLGYLPAVMAADPVVSALVGIIEELAGGIQVAIDSIEHHLDPAMSDPGMLAYLGSWLGLAMDPSEDLDRRREVIRAVGRLLAWRGTQRGLEGLLGALTGSRVRVLDSGGVYVSSDQVPPQNPKVIVHLEHTGGLTTAQLRAFIADELPAGAVAELRIEGPATALEPLAKSDGGDDAGHE